VALFLYVLICSSIIAFDYSKFREKQEQARVVAEKNREDYERQAENERRKQDLLTKGRRVIERASVIARDRGWKIDADKTTVEFATGFDSWSSNYNVESKKPRKFCYTLQGMSSVSKPSDIKITYDEATKGWSATRVIEGHGFNISESDLKEDLYGYAKEVKDLFSALSQAIIETDKAYRTELQSKESVAALKGQPKSEKQTSDDNSLPESTQKSDGPYHGSQSKYKWRRLNALIFLAVLSLCGIGFWFRHRKAKVLKHIVAPTPAISPDPACNESSHRFSCPSCKAKYKVPHNKLGASFRCLKCKSKCLIPSEPGSLDNT
jgi:predicted Zn finger-like uncharacterized protein